MKDPKHLAAIRELPCCICEAFGEQQTSPTTAHHTMCGRYSQKKTSDLKAIPLCDGHHQGLFDTSKIAFHKERKSWVELYGQDTDYIAGTLDRLGL